MMVPFAGEGWGEGMSRMVIDDEMWSRLEKLLPQPKGRHGEDDAYLWKRYAGCFVLVLHGEICLQTMVTGKVFIIVITTGQKKVILPQYWEN
ncbi:hypothetical protein SC065_04630 [Legionella pneumophila serogroup 7]|nr:hypothetical protein [Legionella pneumophila]STX99424.1 ISSod6 transposase [Legionella pneumophila]STX99986.1 ISSod6 transposase [Legionella pneumophila]